MNKRENVAMRLTRTINLMKSHDVMTIACDGAFIKLLEDAKEELKRQTQGDPEIEGDGRSSWWYVCPDCHGQVDNGDGYCRHCGKGLRWK